MAFVDVIMDTACETFLLQQIANVLPPLPARREFVIQVAKLQRIIGIHQKRKALPSSLKKMKKQQGRRAQEVGQQLRKVHALADRVFKEFLRQHNPALTNAEYRKWKADLDSGIREQKLKMRKQVSDMAASRGLGTTPGKGFDRLRAPRPRS